MFKTQYQNNLKTYSRF